MQATSEVQNAFLSTCLEGYSMVQVITDYVPSN